MGDVIGRGMEQMEQGICSRILMECYEIMLLCLSIIPPMTLAKQFQKAIMSGAIARGMPPVPTLALFP